MHPWMSHNVSNTINVKESEWEDVEEFIYENRESFAGISLLGSTGDLDYPQPEDLLMKLYLEKKVTWMTMGRLQVILNCTSKLWNKLVQKHQK